MTDLAPRELRTRERRWATPAGVAAMAGIAFLVGAIVAQQQLVGAIDGRAEALLARDREGTGLLLVAIARALGYLALIGPLLFLFAAAAARSDRARGSLIGLAIAGPVLSAVAVLVGHAAVGEAAADFVAQGGQAGQDEKARDVLSEQGVLGTATGGLGLAGLLALAAISVYSALHGMRTGLLTRFTGTFGMAVGVVMVLPGITQIAVPIYFLVLGPVLAGWMPGSRPPAWEAGMAVEWPGRGEPVVERRDDPENVDPPLASGDDDGAAPAADEDPSPTPQGERRRGRKRRR
ncbi:MAG: hypothetical protein ACR2NA_03065 [Solirubrobacterales bacterium]